MVLYFQFDALERDASGLFDLVRSMKNTFAPINRTPPEILSLIPDYLEDDDRDKNLIVLTHVCHSWREIFISRPSLWTRLDLGNVEKTQVYIERSKSIPLEIHLDPSYEEEAFLLAIPHIRRLKTLSVHGDSDELLPVLVEHFSCPLPLLVDLKVNLERYYDDVSTLPHEPFNGDLSSLRELTLIGVVTPLPWRDLPNLTTLKLHDVPEHRILLTQLLDFFESAPYLRHIELHDSLPSSSNAPTERVVSLPHLKDLSINAERPHSILLNHLSIPARASLHLEFKFDNKHSQISSHLPESPGSLRNLSHITAVNLRFGPLERYIRLNGPSGELYILGTWSRGEEQPNVRASRVIQYLGQFDISRTRWLTITLCSYRPSNPARIAKSRLYRTLHCMEDLRMLTLIQCEYIPFVHALNPNKNPDKVVLCPRLEEIVIYTCLRNPLYADELVDMAEERALRGAKLSAIKLVGVDIVAGSAEGVSLPLSERAKCVEYKFDGTWPEWDTLPG